MRLLELARAAGAHCSAVEWLGHKAEYPFECPQGHAWTNTARQVFDRGVVCPHCRRAAKLQVLQRIALDKGGICLESDYLGSTIRHRFRCAKGHEWATMPTIVRAHGNWCPHCARSQNGISKRHADGLQRLLSVAEARGGSLISTEYLGVDARYEVACSCGHRWTALGLKLLSGQWCDQCARLESSAAKMRTDGLEALRSEAAKHGGVCLSDAYEGTAARYRFRCAKNHEWSSFGSAVLGGSWCLRCSREETAKAKLLGIEVMHQMAAERGGQCLSTEYRGVQHKLEWLCERGHNWWTTPAVIRMGAWCPECARQARITRPKTKARKRYLASPHHSPESSA